MIINSWFLVFVCLFVCFWGGASLLAQTVKNLPAMKETQVRSLGQEYPPGEGNDYPLQHSSLENSMNKGVLWATVHGVAIISL